MSTTAERTAEKTILECRPAMFRNHPIRFVLFVILIFLGFILVITGEAGGWFAVGLGALALGLWWIKVIATRLRVSNRRTTLRKGIISKETWEVRHSDVRQLRVKQGVLQRLLGVGIVEVASAAHGEVEISVSGIRNPENVKQTIDGHRE